MACFIAYEYHTATMQATGRTEWYMAKNSSAAVASLLYTKRLHNGNVRLGPTLRCVYDGRFTYAIVRQQ